MLDLILTCRLNINLGYNDGTKEHRQDSSSRLWPFLIICHATSPTLKRTSPSICLRKVRRDITDFNMEIREILDIDSFLF